MRATSRPKGSGHDLDLSSAPPRSGFSSTIRMRRSPRARQETNLGPSARGRRSSALGGILRRTGAQCPFCSKHETKVAEHVIAYSIGIRCPNCRATPTHKGLKACRFESLRFRLAVALVSVSTSDYLWFPLAERVWILAETENRHSVVLRGATVRYRVVSIARQGYLRNRRHEFANNPDAPVPAGAQEANPSIVGAGPAILSVPRQQQTSYEKAHH